MSACLSVNQGGTNHCTEAHTHASGARDVAKINSRFVGRAGEQIIMSLIIRISRKCDALERGQAENARLEMADMRGFEGLENAELENKRLN